MKRIKRRDPIIISGTALLKNGEVVFMSNASGYDGGICGYSSASPYLRDTIYKHHMVKAMDVDIAQLLDIMTDRIKSERFHMGLHRIGKHTTPEITLHRLTGVMDYLAKRCVSNPELRLLITRLQFDIKAMIQEPYTGFIPHYGPGHKLKQ